MKKTLQAVTAPAQVAHRDLHRVDLPSDLLTTVEAAEHLKYVGPAAVRNFRKWADRHRVPRLHRGRRVLWQSSVLMAFLSGEKWTRDRHAPQSARLSGLPCPNTLSSTDLRRAK